MVRSATSLTSSGVRDWLIQRATAVFMLLYVITLIIACFNMPDHSFKTISAFFRHPWVRAFSFLALLGVVMHAWIGLWTVFTDYVNCKLVRLLLQSAVVLLLISYLVWGGAVLWGIA